MKEMMQGMDKGSHSSVDHEFAALMSKHHQDGITIANNIITYSKDAGLKDMARKMITDQSKEVEQFEAWLAAHKM